MPTSKEIIEANLKIITDEFDVFLVVELTQQLAKKALKTKKSLPALSLAFGGSGRSDGGATHEAENDVPLVLS